MRLAVLWCTLSLKPRPMRRKRKSFILHYVFACHVVRLVVLWCTLSLKPRPVRWKRKSCILQYVSACHFVHLAVLWCALSETTASAMETQCPTSNGLATPSDWPPPVASRATNWAAGHRQRSATASDRPPAVAWPPPVVGHHQWQFNQCVGRRSCGLMKSCISHYDCACHFERLAVLWCTLSRKPRPMRENTQFMHFTTCVCM